MTIGPEFKCRFFFFFFNDTATPEIYTLSLHDALPISGEPLPPPLIPDSGIEECHGIAPGAPARDRKSTRLNSSHSQISYAVFCLKKKHPEPRDLASDRAHRRDPGAGRGPDRWTAVPWL